MNPLSFPGPCEPHRGGVASQSPEQPVVYRHTHLLPMWSAKLRPRQGTGEIVLQGLLNSEISKNGLKSL